MEVLLADPATTSHEAGVLVLDDTGDRKDGTKTAHVARQYLGSIGKTDNGIVAVTSLWADERMYFPLHGQPYTPASRLPGSRRDPAFRTKPQIAVALVDAALEAGIVFRAIVADSFYGDNLTFEETLGTAGLPYVLGLKPSTGIWGPIEAIHTPQEAAAALLWCGPEAPGKWAAVTRCFRDGHEETWWAAELVFGHYSPDRSVRCVVATTDPERLPARSTWYLATNLPCPGSRQADPSPLAPADLAEVVRLYGLRQWVEQSYKQVKQELGWADFMVRSDQAIRRHWYLVCCAFSFCWQAWFTTQDEPGAARATMPVPPGPESEQAGETRGENQWPALDQTGTSRFLADDATPRPRLVGPLEFALALLARLVGQTSAARGAGASGRGWSGPVAVSLSPTLTKYRYSLANRPVRRFASGSGRVSSVTTSSVDRTRPQYWSKSRRIARRPS